MPANDPEYMRKYQAERRKRGRLNPLEQEAEPLPGSCYQHSYKPAEGGMVECRDCGVIVPRGTPTFTDGLPDWDVLIRQIPVKAQAELLGRFPVTKRRTP